MTRLPRTGLGAAWITLACIACSPAQKPDTLVSLDRIAHGAQSEEAKALAPQAYLHALELTRQANQAHDAGDAQRSELLAEQASASFQHAFVLARIAKADARLSEASKKLDTEAAELREIETQQQQISANVTALETRANVLLNTTPLAVNAKSSPERERARREAVGSLITEGRLLCVSAQLLGVSDDTALHHQLDALTALEQRLAHAKVAPIDEAVSARSACLSQLAQARRTHPQPAAAEPTDALLETLSRAGYQPRRDERGVVVTLRHVARGNALTPEAKTHLKELAETARAASDVPLLVVVHSAKGSSSSTDEQAAAAVRDALLSSGVSKVETELVGSRQPLVPPSRPGAADLNARVELTFVAREW